MRRRDETRNGTIRYSGQSFRTNESIFEELVETGVIRPTKLVRHDDFIGDFQFLAETMRYNHHEPMPSLLDCLQLVILHIIYPLSK